MLTSYDYYMAVLGSAEAKIKRQSETIRGQAQTIGDLRGELEEAYKRFDQLKGDLADQDSAGYGEQSVAQGSDEAVQDKAPLRILGLKVNLFNTNQQVVSSVELDPDQVNGELTLNFANRLGVTVSYKEKE